MEKFYDKGLNFECRQCSKCCRHESGLVLLSKADLLKLCNITTMTESEFLLKYCRVVNYQNENHVSLIEKDNKDCVFWQDGCSVYEARPLQCKSYPFWERILDPLAWQEESQSCIGINSSANLVSKETIDNFIKQKELEPLIKLKR